MNAKKLVLVIGIISATLTFGAHASVPTSSAKSLDSVITKPSSEKDMDPLLTAPKAVEAKVTQPPMMVANAMMQPVFQLVYFFCRNGRCQF